MLAGLAELRCYVSCGGKCIQKFPFPPPFTVILDLTKRKRPPPVQGNEGDLDRRPGMWMLSSACIAPARLPTSRNPPPSPLYRISHLGGI